jgi:PTS system nitrogen regulatory IIA component
MAKIIGDLLQDDLVIEEIKATDKIGVIREFAGILQATGRVKDAEALVRVLLERESLGSTGIGDGVAIPHGKLGFISNMVVAFGRSSRGVDFQSLDAKPVYLFFLLVTPDNMPGDHLKALARISRILKNSVLRENLKRTSDRQELKRLIYEEDSKYPQK